MRKLNEFLAKQYRADAEKAGEEIKILKELLRLAKERERVAYDWMWKYGEKAGLVTTTTLGRAKNEHRLR